MKRTLRIAIEAGEHTCRATSDGPWCLHVRLSLFGHSRCNVFDKSLPEVNFDGTPADGSAWLGRLPECKSAEETSR